MLSRTRVLVLLVLLVGPSTACLDALSPITRPVLNGPAAPTPPTPPVGYPALTRPGQEFRSPGLANDSPSRYVLYDDGTFALEFLGAGPDDAYVGTYMMRADSTITLARGEAGSEMVIATGLIQGDALIVDYLEVMEQVGWWDETYLRVSGAE